jgi:hypothetical protein
MNKVKLKKNSLLAFLIFSALLTYSQKSNQKKMNKILLRDAQYYFDLENYESSWKLFKLVLRSDTSNELASVNAAICAYKLSYPLDSVLPLVTALSQSSQIDSKFYLAKIKHQQHLFNEALSLLGSYTQLPAAKRLHNDEETSYLVSTCINAREEIKHPHKVKIKNLGKNINSVYADYVPVIMPDESMLYFTSKREGSSNNKLSADHTYFEDVYFSRNQNGEWTPAENIGAPISTENNDACVAISSDGRRMIIYRNSDDQLSGDLYLTQKGMNNKWEPLELMSYEINSPYIETSACFSRDTSEIFFSSNRPGGFGGKDLYRIKKLPNGSWSPPLNLGSSVNTKYDEDAPFIHPDGVSLYFSSKGHTTMGDYDVFKSVWDKDNIHFSQAENLGYPINDVGSDIFFVLNFNGQRAYYSSAKTDSYGGVDLYQIDTRFNENEPLVEEGLVYINGHAGRAKITLKEKETDETKGIFNSHEVSGKFIILLDPFTTYLAEVEADNCETLVVEIKPLEIDADSHHLVFKLKITNAQ